MDLTGNKYFVDFGMAKAILHIWSESRLSFTIIEKDDKQDNTTETVAVTITELRPALYLLTWKESNGNTVTQVQDHENELIYSNWTLPDGTFNNVTGSIKLLHEEETIGTP
ncbi:MAG: hypothetical protein JWQ38_1031 [Flavipsychrobacter sp.]|nr:hypothetical protein [Flavipsychrobacter sp.]